MNTMNNDETVAASSMPAFTGGIDTKMPNVKIPFKGMKKKVPSVEKASIVKEAPIPESDGVNIITSSSLDQSNNWTNSDSMKTDLIKEGAEVSVPTEAASLPAPTDSNTEPALPVPDSKETNESIINAPATAGADDKIEARHILDLCKDAFLRYSESFILFAYYLFMIKENAWYKLEDYGKHKSMSTFVKETFKLNHSHLYNYLKVWEYFGELSISDGTPEPHLKQDYSNYKLTQLIALCPLKEEERAAATAAMTVQEIKKLRKKSDSTSSMKETKSSCCVKDAKAFITKILKEHKNVSFTITARWD